MTIAASAPCTTLSIRYRPESWHAYQYNCAFGQLGELPVYPVRFVDPTRSRFLEFNEPGATALPLGELAHLAPLVGPLLAKWYCPELGPPTRDASFITLHCSGCDRHVLVDGVHRALWLQVNQQLSVPVQVTELSGSNWPPQTPDFNVVCQCS